jgi:hypothetical protein
MPSCCLTPRFRRAQAAVAILLAAGYAAQMRVCYFAVWRYDADTRALINELAQRRDQQAPELRPGVSWQWEPPVNYYRTVRGWTWLAYSGRTTPSGSWPETEPR